MNLLVAGILIISVIGDRKIMWSVQIIVGRGFLSAPPPPPPTPILWTTSYITYPRFQILSNPPFPIDSNVQPLTPALFVVLCDHATSDVLFFLMILWIYTYWALVPGYCCVFMQYGVKFTKVWHIVQFFASTLIWYHTHTCIHTHIHIKVTEHTQEQTDWHIHINIY